MLLGNNSHLLSLELYLFNNELFFINKFNFKHG
jgi:hypothetical protein